MGIAQNMCAGVAGMGSQSGDHTHAAARKENEVAQSSQGNV